MQAVFYNPAATKKSANLSLNADLLQQAKAKKLNLSRILEERLTELLREEAAQSWQQENRAAIEHYNDRVDKSGTFSDGLRSF